jgi:hypothetical protein
VCVCLSVCVSVCVCVCVSLSLSLCNTQVALTDGTVLPYDWLCVCSGASPRMVAAHPRVLAVRDTDSVQVLGPAPTPHREARGKTYICACTHTDTHTDRHWGLTSHACATVHAHTGFSDTAGIRTPPGAGR